MSKSKQSGGNGNNRALCSSVAPPNSVAPRSVTFGGGGGTNRLYGLNNCKEQDNSPDVISGMIQVFHVTVNALLDPGSSLSFVTLYYEL